MKQTSESNLIKPLSGAQKWLALTVGLLALALFFRQHLANHFSLLSGDRYDAVIVAALLEHWFNVFKGAAHWASPNYFFPYAKTLSYNDGYFLYGAIYSVFRACALDPFLSSELVNVSVKAIGFGGFLLAARRMLKLPFHWALLGALIFTLSNNSYVQIAHAQLLAVAFTPLIAWLLHAAIGALLAGRRRALLCHGVAAALLFAALLMTSAYTAWFFALFACIAIAVQLVLLRGAYAPLLLALRQQAGALLLLAAVGVLALAPFVHAYLLGHHGQRSWGELTPYIPSVLDSINPGYGNYLFGDLFGWLRQHCTACDIGTGERETGVGPLLLLLAALGTGGLLWRRRHGDAVNLLVLGLGLACAVTWLLAVRVGPVTGWYLVYKLWPGASGLRVVSRIFIVLSGPLIALVMWHCSQQQAKWGSTRRGRLLLPLLCVLLVGEQLNGRATVGVDRAQLVGHTAAATPPAACRAFYTTQSPDSDTGPNADFVAASLAHNIDAMVIAELVNLPTINGHASFTPPDWNFAAPARADYQQRVRAYARAHAISGLCRLDLLNLQWQLDADVRPAPGVIARWDFAAPGNGGAMGLEGFDAAEPFGRWSIAKQAWFRYALPAGAAAPSMVRLTLATMLATPAHPQRVGISVNQQPARQFVFTGSGPQTLDLPLPASPDRAGVISFALPDLISPRELGVNADGRTLAIGLQSIELR